MTNHFIEQILKGIETDITDGTFRPFETHKVELKSLAGGEHWQELYNTVCAFLNSAYSGMVICGIWENTAKKRYEVKGFDPNLENKLKTELLKGDNFFDEQGRKMPLNQRNINFELRDFMGKQIALIIVDPLPDDERYIFTHKSKKDSADVKCVAYKRVMTGDDRVTKTDLEIQAEYKAQLVLARELEIMEGSKINDLSIRSINNLIDMLSKHRGGMRHNNIKNLEDAGAFLEENYFTRDGKVTLLGLLACCEKPQLVIDKRGEVDCIVYVKGKIAADKLFLDLGDILTLMTESFHFVWKHIKIATVFTNGGQTEPEFSEELIREVVNNALAHRDYKANRPIQIIITHHPTTIEIKNAGTFFTRMIIDNYTCKIPVRRIKPPKGTPESKNPKLARLLKNLDKIENMGRGMTTLVDEALANRIDLPYYKIDDDTISLTIPSGNLLDTNVRQLIDAYDGYIEQKLDGMALTEEQKILIAYLYKAEMQDENDNYTILITKSNNHKEALKQLEKKGLIYAHELSPQYYPIYMLDRKLLKIDFIPELRTLFGKTFDELRKEYKNVLNTIYLFSHFRREKIISANDVSTYLFYKENKVVIDIRKLDNFKRGIRNICNHLVSWNFIRNLGDNKFRPKYELNKNYLNGNVDAEL